MVRKSAAQNNNLSSELLEYLHERIMLSTRRQKEGKITYLIGNNGTGKSSILGRLAERMESIRPPRNVACIANSIYDKFKFKSAGTGRIHYLGAKNAPNAVFHAAIDRQLSRLILQALLIDRQLLKRLSDAVNVKFSFSLGDDLTEQVEERIDLKTKKGQARSDLLTPRSLGMLQRISERGGKFENLTEPQIRVFLRYLELNIDFDLYVRLHDESLLKFEHLSTGEQNRILLFAKILSVMD